MELISILNERYGTKVATNGSYVVIGNPPSKNWSYDEGFSRNGEVVVIKKNSYVNNYSVVKTLKNDYSKTIITPYYTEQSSSAVNTSSLIANSASLSGINNSCSFLILEKGSQPVYQSKYGESFDLCDYFLAISDKSFSQSLALDVFVSQTAVNIYEINPNYSFDTSSVNIIQPTKLVCNTENFENYEISDIPFAVITGSSNEDFGRDVSITNNYLAIGAPNAYNGRGAVYIYKYTDSDTNYSLQTILTSSTVIDSNQRRFGYSICLDKYSESKMVVGTDMISGSKVYLFNSSSKGWYISQRFENLTGSRYISIENQIFDLSPSSSFSVAQRNNKFGYSVSLNKNLLVIGSPTDLLYYEYSGSSTLRQRGATYIYQNNQCPSGSNQYSLLTKTYGDDKIFKDNLFGYAVSTFDNYVLIGSPKQYFPFSSLYLSNSINKYEKYYSQNDFGQSSYCGQACFYKVSGSSLLNLTTDPISKVKNYDISYNAFASSVAVSDSNLVIGAPIPLNDDLYLSSPIITESGSASDVSYINTSSYQSDSCDETSDVVYYQIEDTVYSENSNLTKIALKVEDEIVEQLKGKCFIYDFNDLQSNFPIGNVFYNNNKIVINNTGSILGTYGRDPVNENKPYIYVSFESQLTLNEKQYICKIEPGEFNISTNPTAVTSSAIDYGIFNKDNFDFRNCDIILRYINYKITNPRSENWWTTFIGNDIEQNIFNYYSSSIINYNTNKLDDSLKCTLANKNFDINKDGTVDVLDGILIWKYFSGQLNFNNYKNYINPLSRRNDYDSIFSFLNKKTGKFNKKTIKKQFFDYQHSSSLDVTGSYLAPYITTVGLYDNANLVAVAKLAHPIKNSGEIPINILVKWDT